MSKKRYIDDFPDLIKEWNYNKNKKNGIETNSYVIGSSKKVWWKCSKCGHEWETAIRHRTLRGNGCPICARKQRTKTRLKNILNKKGCITNPLLLQEWDYEKNEEVNPQDFSEGSRQSIWWKCSKCGNSWKTSILNRKTKGCPYCANRIVTLGKNDLATTHPLLVKEWDYKRNGKVLPTQVSYGSNRKVWWICPNGHSYQAVIAHRTSGTNCPICNSGKQTSFAEQAFLFYIKKLYPDAINRYSDIFTSNMELDIYIPSIKTGIEYDGSFWHKNKRQSEEKKYSICKQNGIKLIRIREDGKDCKNIADCCYSIENSDNIKSLESLIIFVLTDLTQWSRRTNRLPFTVDLEQDSFEIRKNILCLNKQSLAIIRPDLTNEWDIEKNGELSPNKVLPNSTQKVWWKCSNCGHVWKTAIRLRVAGSGCPKCFVAKNRSGNHAEAKKVFQYTIDGTFIKAWHCISDAGRELRINTRNISTCANHQRRVAGGFRWEFYYANQLPPIVAIKTRQKNTGGKAIIQMDGNDNVLASYSSLSEAATKLGINATSISKALHGTINKAGGYKWKFK